MFVTLTLTDPDKTKITFIADKIVAFGPDLKSPYSKPAVGWSVPAARIYDLTDAGDSGGTPVIEEYEYVMEQIQNALAGK